MLYDTASVDFANKETEDRDAQLRLIERQFGWKADPWHFSLLPHLPNPAANFVHSFFRNAKFQDGVLFFNGGSKNGCMSFEYVRRNFFYQLLSAFGEITVKLAHERKIISEYSVKGFSKKEKTPDNPDKKSCQILPSQAQAGQGNDFSPNTEGFSF